MEELLKDELAQKWKILFPESELSLKVIEGGIEIECELYQGLHLNHYLKIATRILLRLKTQKCRDFPKLFKIIQKINWKLYTKRDDLEFKITAKESRLIHTGKMKKTCEDALIKYFNANSLPQKIKDEKERYQRQKVFVRVDNDNLTISLDTSGEALYERELGKFKGHAPLRASLASGILYAVFQNIKERVNLVDPMCGSGTFLTEAINFFKVNENRVFAYQDWSETNPFSHLNHDFLIEKGYGFDKDPKVIGNLKIPNCKVADIFNDNYHVENALVICNPPYGKRVKLDRERQKYFQDLVTAIEKNIKPKYLSILVPEDIELKRFTEKRKIFNSGIWTINYFIVY